MSFEAGHIHYTVSMETGKLLIGEKQVATAADNVAQKFGNVDAAGTKLNAKLNTTTRAVRATTDQMKKMRGVVGGLGYQVQDIAVQMQSGTDSLIILGQQGSQIASLFGPGGAVLGAILAVGAAAGSVMAPALFNSKSALDEMQASLERVKATITLSSAGIAEYTDQMKLLARTSEGLVKAKLALTIAEQNDALKKGAVALRDITKDATSFVNIFGSFDDVVANITGKKLGQDGFNDARESLIEFKKEVALFSHKPTEEGADDLTRAIDRLTAAGATNTKQGRALLKASIEQVDLWRVGKITIDQLSESIKESSNLAGGNASEIKNMVSALKLQAETLGFTDRELAIYLATMRGAQAADMAAINSSYNKIEAYEAEQQAIKDKADAEKKARSDKLKADRELAKEQANLAKFDNLVSNAEAGNSTPAVALKLKEQNEMKRLTDAFLKSDLASVKDYEKAKLDIQAKYKQLTVEAERQAAEKRQSLLESVDPMVAEQNRYDQQLQNLKVFHDSVTMEDERYRTLKTQLEQEHSARIQEIREQEFRAQSEGNEFLMGSFDALGNAASNSFSSMISGSMSSKDAVLHFAQAIQNEAIGALVQMGIQAVKNSVLESTLNTKKLTEEKAVKAANGAAYAVAISAQVATTTALAAQNAFAATAAIPIVGPGLASAAAATAGAAAATLGAPAIATAPFAGARKNGGPVSAGSLYRVGEGGQPEIFKASSGKLGMIPGENGEVIPLNKMSKGGGAAPVINLSFTSNIHVEEGEGMEDRIEFAEQISDMTINRVIEDFDTNGPIRSRLPI